MIEVMVDLETLGTKPGCKILSIGAVVFDASGTQQEFYTEVRRDGQANLHEDQQTLAWWSGQTSAAKDRLFNDSPAKQYLNMALASFDAWLISLTDRDKRGNLNAHVWGNGADFDNVILKSAYDAVSPSSEPWGPWNNRCYRTLKSLAPEVKLERVGVHHNALDDAISQALHAVRIIEKLGIKYE